LTIDYKQLHKDALKEIETEDYRTLLDQLKAQMRANRKAPELPEEVEPVVRMCFDTRMPCIHGCGLGLCKRLAGR
jgi:hypothetical protein